MRTSLYLVGFAAASIMGAGAVGFGCSSSSSPAAAVDSGTTEASPEEAGGDGGGEDAPAAEAAACMPSGINVATMNFGSASWACFQAKCMPSLTMCAADCDCDNGILGALQCAADGGAAATMGCFVTAFGTLSSNAAGMAAEACIVQMNTPPSGACSGGGSTDGGGEGGDAAPTTTDSGSAMDAADGGG